MGKFNVGDIVYGLPTARDKYYLTTSRAKMMVVESVHFKLISKFEEDDMYVIILEHLKFPEEIGYIFKVKSEFFTKDVPWEFIKTEVLSTIDDNVAEGVEEGFSKKVHEALLQILSREKY